MTITESETRSDETPPAAASARLRPLTVAAVASLSAGAVHAAAIGAHADHPAAAKVFAVVAMLQLLWGGVALVRRTRDIALIGVVLNGALFGGWVLAKWQGLGFISGLGDAEPVQFADGLCAALAVISAVAAAAVFLDLRPRRTQPQVALAAVVVLGLTALPGMVEAGRHIHAGTKVTVKAAPKIAKATALLPTAPYDPKKPLDLGGVKGVSQGEQARAENLVSDTLIRLPQWSDPAKAKAAGYVAITEHDTGFEHLVNWKALNDKRTFDPNYPEGLIYQVKNGKRTLMSAIFALAPGSNPKRLPDIGGPLIRWKTRVALCAVTGGKRAHVARYADSKGGCPRGQTAIKPVPMFHLWIVAHPCGPFAMSADGAGRVRQGEVPVCPDGEGSSGTTL